MITCVTDLAWGDTGKGKIIDSIAGKYNAVVRFNGGPNAGHTICVNNKKMSFHNLPSSMFVDNSPDFAVLSGGMVVNPVGLVDEMKKYLFNEESEASVKNLVISNRIHCIMPWHIKEDFESSKDSIGTTGKGIGPCYANKMRRTGAVRLGDLQDFVDNRWRPNPLNENFEQEIKDKEAYKKAADFLQPYISDERPVLRDLIKKNKDVLFESANGIQLDVDHGSYPFVTSSGCGPAFIPQSCGLPNLHIDKIIGITKAYTTRVGNGDLPTEIQDERIRDHIRVMGGEYGTTTGRARRIGWLDLDIVREGCLNTGATEIAITHMDTIAIACKMCGLNTFKCKMDESYFEFQVWSENTDYKKDVIIYNFIKTIENFTGIPVSMLGTGRNRESIIYR